MPRVLDIFPALKAVMPPELSFIFVWDLTLASLGIVASLALLLLSDFVVSPFIFVPLFFVLVWLLSAYGFNSQKRWAWNLGMASAILSLLVTPLLLFPLFRLILIPWVIVWPSSIYFLTRPHVRRFLGKMNRSDSPEPDPSNSHIDNRR